MTTALTTTPLTDFRVAIIPEAQQAKRDALALAAPITSVGTVAEQQDAIGAASLCKGLLRDVEKAREEVKKPVLEAGRRIDTAAKDYAKELDAEVKRLEKLAADFQREEDRRAEALRREEERRQQEQRAAEEAERQKEKDALARIAAAAEQERRAALAKIQAAQDEESRRLAQIEADQLAEARAEEVRVNQLACIEAEEKRQESMRERHSALQDIAPPKPQGAVVKRAMDYELKDIRALYAARPDLVELTERRSLILAAIAIPNAPAIPGLYVFEKTSVQSRAS